MSLKLIFVRLATALLIAGASASVMTAPAMAGTAGAPSGGVAAEAQKGHWQWAHARYWFVDGVSMWAARANCHAWGRYGVQKDWWPKYQCRLKFMHYSLYEWAS